MQETYENKVYLILSKFYEFLDYLYKKTNIKNYSAFFTP